VLRVEGQVGGSRGRDERRHDLEGNKGEQAERQQPDRMQAPERQKTKRTERGWRTEGRHEGRPQVSTGSALSSGPEVRPQSSGPRPT